MDFCFVQCGNGDFTNDCGALDAPREYYYQPDYLDRVHSPRNSATMDILSKGIRRRDSKTDNRSSATDSLSGPTPQSSRWFDQITESAGRTVRSWTVTKHALPDRNVASQILMLRQLLHTKCRPGLKLSRPYQGTPAQIQVQHLPWWEVTAEGKTMVDTGTMVLSYDNLITRLWKRGYFDCLTPTIVTPPSGSTGSSPLFENSNVSSIPNHEPFLSLLVPCATSAGDDKDSGHVEEKKEPAQTVVMKPPIPHEYWYDYEN
jgi:hypothetical protein